MDHTRECDDARLRAFNARTLYAQNLDIALEIRLADELHNAELDYAAARERCDQAHS